MDPKTFLGLVASFLVLFAYIPYIRSILRKEVKPHIFTWIIWTLLTFIAFCAQVIKGAGPGAWPTGIVVTLAVIITFLSVKSGEKDITRSDWWMFIGGVAAIPLWWITNDPTGSVIIVTLIDALAFGPTIRKSWNKPHEEPTLMYGLHTLRHGITVAALSNYSIATAFFPSVMIFMNALTAVLLLWRRKKLG